MEFKLYYLVCISGLIVYYVEAFDESNVHDEINFINSVQSSWKAEPSLDVGIDTKAWKKKLGLRLDTKELYKLMKRSQRRFAFKSVPSSASGSSTIPKNFDLRKASGDCNPLIALIRDQSNCGSCWAVASASVLSDRFCIASKGQYKIPLSAEDLLRCCDKCKPAGGNGCEGGKLGAAMEYLYNDGIVTGGEYGSKMGCMPYSFEPCSNSGAECVYAGKNAKTAKCVESCTNPDYQTSYKLDKYFIDDAYAFTNNQTDRIKNELMSGGSCVAIMKVYEDFMNYKKGIYEYVKGEPLGDHAVRLIGWGMQKKSEYWLAANSWGNFRRTEFQSLRDIFVFLCTFLRYAAVSSIKFNPLEEVGHCTWIMFNY